jgi:aminopeptidase N
MLPCFDQPNIKARLTLAVAAPADWKVFGNSASTAATRASTGDSVAHSFAETEPIAPYLFALVAGPFDSFHDSFGDGRVPLGLHCRRSLTQHLDHDELFELTKQGFAFYESFFACRYPFQKYDQVFCPEFNVGAMENVGLVTFNEGYVFKDPPTLARRAKRADTLLHEMSHMWFGNLVTCNWWDGLWLNESFATYTAALAVAECTKFGAISWLNFNSSMKQWAMREDQMSTTHPVQSPVRDTEQALANFDGLTYGKGSSLLKQLVFTVGMDGFRTGMRGYFSKHAWGNTTLVDFLQALAAGASSVGRSLDPVAWSASFLETAGLNACEAVVQLSADQRSVESAALVQSAVSAQHAHLREHWLQLGVYDDCDERGVPHALTLRQTIEVCRCTVFRIGTYMAVCSPIPVSNRGNRSA